MYHKIYLLKVICETNENFIGVVQNSNKYSAAQLLGNMNNLCLYIQFYLI